MDERRDKSILTSAAMVQVSGISHTAKSISKVNSDSD